MDVRHDPSFADLVRAVRKQHRLSQRALARQLDVSPGYVGQWELRLSQPSPDVVAKLCRLFGITDSEHVQRLAFAERAPDWLKDAIVATKIPGEEQPLMPIERRILDAVRKLPEPQRMLLAERIEAWVEAKLESAR